MGFLNTIWLWGLLGVAIPIGIHLLSRKEGKTIYVGSLRHLIDSNTTRFSSLRLNEILLLMLRISFITIIIFLLAEVILPFKNAPEKKWALLEEGVERNQRMKPMLDSLQTDNFQLRFLAKNFPSITDSASVEAITNYNSLVVDLTEQGVSEVVIISYTLVNHFRGERISLPENIRWFTVESPLKEFVALAQKNSDDTLMVRSGKTTETETSFSTKLIGSTQSVGDLYQNHSDTTKITESKKLNVLIQFEKDFEDDVKMIEASLKAIASETHSSINIQKADTKNSSTTGSDLIFWLSSETPPDSIKNTIAFLTCEGGALPLLVESNSASLWCKHSANVEWLLTKRLTQENVLEENFTMTLAKIIAPKSKTLEMQITDSRSLPLAMAWSKSKREVKVESQTRSSIETYLVIVLLVILITERFVAFKRNQ